MKVSTTVNNNIFVLVVVVVVVICLTAMKVDGASHYPCFVNGDPGEKNIMIDVSPECCLDSIKLFDENTAALEVELSQCTTHIMETMLIKYDDHCDEDGTNCAIDYHDFTCDDEFALHCLTLGGKILEMDVTMTCHDFTNLRSSHLRILNKIDCVALSCDEEESLRIYGSIANEDPDLEGCTMTVNYKGTRTSDTPHQGFSFFTWMMPIAITSYELYPTM